MRRLALIAVLALGLAVPALVRAATQPISFWGSTADAVGVPKGATSQGNALVVRPSVIDMYADGSWDIDHLHWSDWGSATARATGISSASNGIPNEAQGKRITHPADVVLSDPGHFDGHAVYRCFSLTVPAFAASDEQLCLKDRAGYWYLQSTAAHLHDFLSPDHKVWCEMGGSPMFCATGGSEASAPQRLATLSVAGKVTSCFVATPGLTAGCIQNWDSVAPVLRYGQVTESGVFRCTSATTGITCIVLAGRGVNKGFAISDTGVSRVGASVAGSVASSGTGWQAIAGRAKFPVYRPTQTLGLKLSGLILSRSGCLIASYGSDSGPEIAFDEPGDSESCGQPGIANPVATTRINGVKVQVLVQCSAVPKCTVKDGARTGFLLFVPEPKHKSYSIQLQSQHLSLSRFLTVAKSFVRVPK